MTHKPNARALARQLYRDDMSRADEVPVATDGHRAYDGWLRASGDAADRDTFEALEAVDRDAFAAAWNDCVSSDRIARASKHIDAILLPTGDYAHYAAETGTYWVCTAGELEELCDYLDDPDPQISRDAYSHWCAGTSATERPKGWTPIVYEGTDG